MMPPAHLPEGKLWNSRHSASYPAF
jgi:hypothetical protein